MSTMGDGIGEGERHSSGSSIVGGLSSGGLSSFNNSRWIWIEVDFDNGIPNLCWLLLMEACFPNFDMREKLTSELFAMFLSPRI